MTKPIKRQLEKQVVKAANELAEAVGRIVILNETEILRIVKESQNLHRPMTVSYFTLGYVEGSMHGKTEPKTEIGNSTIGELQDVQWVLKEYRRAVARLKGENHGK